MPHPNTLPAQARLLHPAHLPFTVGAVALVTLGAFENRAVTTILPSVARDLEGLSLFGAASAAPLVSFVVATTLAGLWSDSRGPVPVLRAGMGAFVAGELTMALAPSMQLFVLGRLLGGLAEGLLDIGLTVLVARALPAELRPRVFAAFAAAWVLPSLLGPSMVGVVAEHLGWRVVFFLGVALLGPVAACLRPALRAARSPGDLGSAGSRLVRAGTTESDAPTLTGSRRQAGWSVVAAAGLVALSVGGSMVAGAEAVALVGWALLLAGLATVLRSARAVLPPGSLTAAPGIPALTALRALLGAAFGTAGGLLPLMLTDVHGYGPAAAGVSLTVTGLFWALGSQLQGLDHVQARTSVPSRLRIGFALVTVGLVGPTLLAVSLLPAWAGLGMWALAGVGIGICSPTISTHVLTLSREQDQGRNSAASVLAPAMAQAVSFAASGALIAWEAPDLGGGLFAGIIAACAGLSALALVLAGRAAQPRPAGQRQGGQVAGQRGGQR
ncbi:MFS transporter [Pedococcus sp. 5OH_020]|uniref:MFS transporter n=1 Tax=Pedococcus sp. 5OH_020 TaxID=2989814 RepID=UPI0022E99B4B|nr:MFS transporter [Pedococcus sp. 5OH_020]